MIKHQSRLPRRIWLPGKHVWAYIPAERANMAQIVEACSRYGVPIPTTAGGR